MPACLPRRVELGGEIGDEDDLRGVCSGRRRNAPVGAGRLSACLWIVTNRKTSTQGKVVLLGARSYWAPEAQKM